MPPFLRSDDLPLEQIGLVLAAGTVVRIVTEPAAGRLPDHLGARKQVLTAAAGLSGVIDWADTLVFHVFGAIAQSERRLIAERTRDGLAAARARGNGLGRPALDLDKLAAALVLVDQELSVTNAAAITGLGRSTVYRKMQRRGPAA